MMNKTDVIKFLNENTSGKKVGRKEFKISDIFISSKDPNIHFRLSKLGREILSKHLRQYKISLSVKNTTINSVTALQILTLDRYMTSPYYLSSRGTLYTYEQAVASEFLLIDGDFDHWVNTKKFAENVT